MTNQLSQGNLLPDFSKVTLRRVFKTDQGWIMEAHGQNSAICPGCQRISRCAIAGTGVLCETFLSKARRWSSGCTWVAGVAGTLCASGESLPNLSPRFRAIRTTDQAIRRDHLRSRACPRRTFRPTLDAQARDPSQRRYAGHSSDQAF